MEVEETNFLYLMNYLGSSEHDFARLQSEKKGGTKKKLSKLEERQKKYNERIANYMGKIKHRLHLFNFYKCYEEDPLKFIQNFLAQQNALLRVFKTENKPATPKDPPMRNVEAVVKKYVEENSKPAEANKE